MERWGVIDRLGEIIIPFDYKRCDVFSEGLFCVSPFMHTWKFGFVNTKNQKVIPTIYDNASSFSDGMACVRKEMLYEKVKSKNDWFYINSKGERVFENGFYHAKSFMNGFAVVSSQNEQGTHSKYGLIGKNGKFKIEPKYSDMGHQFNEGLIPVAKKINTIGKFGEYEVDKFGFVDINNDLIIPFKFDRAEPFSDSLAVVVKNGGKRKYGFIDMKGKIVVDYIFDFAHSFKNNLALVQIGENSGYIDSKGNQYWE